MPINCGDYSSFQDCIDANGPFSDIDCAECNFDGGNSYFDDTGDLQCPPFQEMGLEGECVPTCFGNWFWDYEQEECLLDTGFGDDPETGEMSYFNCAINNMTGQFLPPECDQYDLDTPWWEELYVDPGPFTDPHEDIDDSSGTGMNYSILIGLALVLMLG